MRVVLDAHVLVSGLLAPDGTCGRVVDLLLGGAIELCVDDRISGEYAEVLQRPELRIAPDDAAEVLGFVRGVVHLVPAALLGVTLPDADDLPFLEVARAAGAALVTGNARHFPAEARADVTVLSAGELLERVRGQ